jgi:hypothetical protein
MNPAAHVRIGEVTLFDGVGVLARGDLLLVAYGADASLQRTRWLHSVAEEFSRTCATNALLLLVITAGSKPPDPATRAEDTKGYNRLLPKLRRLVVVPEGTGFRASLVRLVVGAYVTLTGRHTLAIAATVEQGFARIQEVRSSLTPDVDQLAKDLDALRAELATSYPMRPSLSSASARLSSK